MPGLNPGILFLPGKEGPRVKPGGDEISDLIMPGLDPGILVVVANGDPQQRCCGKITNCLKENGRKPLRLKIKTVYCRRSGSGE